MAGNGGPPGKLHSDPVSYADGGHRYESVLCEPGSASLLPAVIILHGLFGLQDMDSGFAARLAGEGYVTLVHGWQTEDPDPSDREIVSGVGAAAAWLSRRESVDADRLALIGICRGGTLALLSAASMDLFRAVVSLYGQARYPCHDQRRPVSPIDCLESINAPVLLVHGEADRTFPVEESRALARRLRALGKRHATGYFAGAGHGFLLEGHRNHDPVAAQQAWPVLLRFLDGEARRPRHCR